MKVAYLFTNPRGEMAKAVEHGKDHDDHFFGMFRLREHGMDATFLELETVFPVSLAQFLRKHVLSMHFVHVPLLWKLRKYDVVLTSAALGALLVRTITGIGPRKWIMYDYNVSGIVQNATTWKEKVYAWLMGKVDGFITLSAKEAEVLKEMYPEKADNIAFIPFGCDTNYWQPRTDIAVEKDLVVSVGRDPGRDWKTLVEAVRGMPVRLELTLREEQLHKVGDIPDNVRTHPRSPQELVDLFARASVVVLPLAPKYPNDTMGLSTLVEAMAMGKAIIATDTVTIRNYIKDGESGALVPKGDVAALRQAIEQIQQSSEIKEAYGTASRQKVTTICNANQVTGQLFSFLRAIAK